jgi:hypothetical protein
MFLMVAVENSKTMLIDFQDNMKFIIYKRRSFLYKKISTAKFA